MGVTHQDVEMLNNSMRYAGGAFRQTRLDNEQLRQQGIENDLRRRTLEAGQQRTDLAASGEVDAFLSGEDGGVVQYKGSPQGLQKVMEEAQTKGKPLRQVSAPTKKPSIGTFTTHTPLGDFTFHLNDAAEVDKVSQLAKSIGGKQKEAGKFNTAPIANAEHMESLWAALAAAKTPDEKAAAQQKLDTFTEMARKGPDDDMETVTEDYEAVPGTPEIPEQPAEKWTFLGIDGLAKDKPAVPGIPGTPGLPKRHVTYKQPKGTAGQKPEASAPAPMPVPQPKQAAVEAPRDPKKRKAGTAYVTPKGLMTWTGTGWLPQ